jgi:hypothetical protein
VPGRDVAVPTLVAVPDLPDVPALPALRALSRGGALAAWTTAVLDGRVDPDRAMTALAEPDVEQVVTSPDGEPGLLGLVAWCRGSRVPRLWCVAAAPGDVAALPGPAAFNSAAATAGAAVLLDGAPVGLVATTTRHGSSVDHVDVVRWNPTECSPRPDHARALPPGLAVGDADRTLLEALRAAVEDLEQLDVARDRAGVREAVVAGRGSPPLPPGAGDRAARLLRRAQQTLVTVELATTDSGGSTTSHETLRRATVLAEVARAARAAVAAAWNAAAEASAASAAAAGRPQPVPGARSPRTRG